MKMIQWLKHIILVILFMTPVLCRSVSGRSFLWKVEGANNHVYLLGSIHLLKKEVYPLQPVIEKSFDNSEVLAVEANVSSENMIELTRLTMEKGLYQGNETLKQNLSEKTYSLLVKKLKEFGMEISGFRQFKPWFMALTLTGMELMRMGFDPNYGIDKYFLEKAVKLNKRITELEGAEFQINLFNSFSREELDMFLASTLVDIDGYKETINDMVKFWQQGLTSQMEQLLNKNINQYPELAKLNHKIIDERNFSMTEKIISYLNSARVHFVVVGAAHLVGDSGILNLLGKKGFILTQL